MRMMQILAGFFVATILIASAGTFSPALALLADHDCSFCHSFHGAPGNEGLLNEVNSELVCLSCHYASINDTEAGEVHNPLGLASDQLGYITCRECHTPHDNIGGNVKLIGYKYDPENNQAVTGPAIRYEVPGLLGAPVYRPVTFYNAVTDFNVDDTFPGTGVCEVCHSPYHNQGNDCTACHSHSSGFPAPDCTAVGCHDNTESTEFPLADFPGRRVTDASPHAKDIILTNHSATLTCGDCHGGHSSTVSVPNNASVGIHYDASGHNGIALNSSLGSTEAEVCWNCHDIYGISEWGQNTDTNGTANDYDLGAIYTNSTTTTLTSNWVGAWWESPTAQFAYKTGQIQSTHSVNNAVTGPGVDTVGQIKCSYCHDVHELNLATGDSTSGQPYLRGTWKGNPYKEDGAPSGAWDTYGSTAPLKWGAVPRGLNSNNTLGGYQIDQNNNSPTNSWTRDNSAGLCFLCHDKNKDGAFVTVDTLDWYGSNDWVGTNGHSNAALGGTGSNKFNIYNPTTRAEGNAYNNPSMAYNNVTTFPTSDWMYGLRNMQGGGYSYAQVDTTTENNRGVTPPIYIGASGNQRYTYKNSISWGVDFDTTVAQEQYHKFSCSKCHNPHASRLPRLMITNCLDVQRNTWDGNFIGDPDWTLGKINTNANFDFSASNIMKAEFRGTSDSQGLRNKQLAYAKSAQNCHRYVDVNGDGIMDVGDEPGWNKVTPW